MKIISDTTHGILDYVTVVLFALAPSVLGLTGTAALISYALAAIHLTMTVLTDMPLGVIKIIPIKLHAFVELAVGSREEKFVNRQNRLYEAMRYFAIGEAANLLISLASRPSPGSAKPQKSM